MSNYTINDSIFKLLFGAVGVAVHNMRVRHAKRRLEKAFQHAIKLSENPEIKKCNHLDFGDIFYLKISKSSTLEINAASVFLDSVANLIDSEAERNENEN